MILDKDERLEDLQCQGLKIIQNKNLYAFTSDSVVLANFVKTKASDEVVEIGAGCGVISILVHAKNKLKRIHAFEIQKEMQKLCEKNIELNNLNEKIFTICDDVKNFDKYIQKESIDVVFSNPPYFKSTNFEQKDVKKIAKEDIKLSARDLIVSASKMLKYGGSFFCCYTSERTCELIELCKRNNLEVKEMFFTENGKGAVKLVVLKAVKGGKIGVKIYQNLITNEESGNYLEKLHTKYFL